MTNVRSITPLPPADFTPELGNYKALQPFRYWCQKVLPLVYDDSLSYYELLCKVIDYLNKTMQDVETLHGDVTKLYTAYDKLQDYVNNYFKSLDVQEEINKKLDEMVKDGTLGELINKIIGNDYISVKNYGCVGDGVTDDSDGFINAIKYCVENNKILFLPLGDYVITKNLPDLPLSFCIKGVNVGNKINGYGSRIIDKRKTSTPLLNLTLSSENGGCIENVIFDDPDHITNKTCISRSKGGWTFIISGCSFFSYDTAMYLAGDDGRILNCQFALCGSNTKISNNPNYCVVINQSNEKRFYGCHFEHIRFMVHILGSSYFNSFNSCKFEQGTPNSNVDNTNPIIWIESTQYNYSNSFIDCTFHGVDIEYYIDNNICENYADVPYLLSSTNDSNIIITGCSFTSGPGSGSTIYKQFAQSKFIKAVNAQISNCCFIKPAFNTYCIEVKNALISNIEFFIDFTGNYTKESGNVLINRTFYPYNYYTVNNVFIKYINQQYKTIVLDMCGSDYLCDIRPCIKTNYHYGYPYMCFEIHPNTSPFNGIWDVTVLNPLEGYNFGTFTFAIETDKITILDTSRFIRHSNYNITIAKKGDTIYVFIPGSNNNARNVIFKNQQPCNIYRNNNISNIIESPDVQKTVWE